MPNLVGRKNCYRQVRTDIQPLWACSAHTGGASGKSFNLLKCLAAEVCLASGVHCNSICRDAAISTEELGVLVLWSSVALDENRDAKTSRTVLPLYEKEQFLV